LPKAKIQIHRGGTKDTENEHGEEPTDCKKRQTGGCQSPHYPKRLKNMKICTKVYTSGGLRQGPTAKSQKRALRQPKFLKQASISYSHGTETESLVDAKARQLREGNRAEPDVHQWIAGAAFYRIKTGPDGQRNSDNAAS